MTTVADILSKIASKTAVKADFDQLAKLYEAEAEAEKKADEIFIKLIDTIGKAKIDPTKLYNELFEKGLIIPPIGEEKSDKVILAVEKITTKEGRASTFKIWEGRNLNTLTGDAKAYWTTLHAKGKEHFKSILTAEGKAKGEQWIDSLFAK
jgi:hypothetical protein